MNSVIFSGGKYKTQTNRNRCISIKQQNNYPPTTTTRQANRMTWKCRFVTSLHMWHEYDTVSEWIALFQMQVLILGSRQSNKFLPSILNLILIKIWSHFTSATKHSEQSVPLNAYQRPRCRCRRDKATAAHGPCVYYRTVWLQTAQNSPIKANTRTETTHAGHYFSIIIITPLVITSFIHSSNYLSIPTPTLTFVITITCKVGSILLRSMWTPPVFEYQFRGCCDVCCDDSGETNYYGRTSTQCRGGGWQ